MNLEQVLLKGQGKDYSRQYLWNIRIPDAPAPFDTWFPASEVSEPKGNIASHTFSYHIRGLSAPLSTASETLSVTFYDREDQILLNFFVDWMRDILGLNEKGGNRGILTLRESVKPIEIEKLNHAKEVVSRTRYFVYPEGSLLDELTSESSASTYTLSFIVAGDDKVAREEASSGGSESNDEDENWGR